MHDVRDKGASAVEYGLLVAAIAFAIIAIVIALGGVVQEVFTTTCDTVAEEAQTTENCT
jgi:pilus assembly protein Flp/PilA